MTKVAAIPANKFRVWGLIDNERFDRKFPTAAAWRAWRRLYEDRMEIEVLGMASVDPE